jgi:CDP-diacylglycerol--glycerol-3-phosphate 3-phosphatidyltransferase
MRILRHLPNALTLARLVALPVLMAMVLAADGPTSGSVAWFFFALAATDFIDGKLARALHAESRFGQIADPLADRLLVAVGLVAVILLDRLNWTAPAIILARDAVGMATFALYARRGRILEVDFAGKASSMLVMVATWLVLLSSAGWLDVVFWVAVAGSVGTLLNYARRVGRPPPRKILST